MAGRSVFPSAFKAAMPLSTNVATSRCRDSSLAADQNRCRPSWVVRASHFRCNRPIHGSSVFVLTCVLRGLPLDRPPLVNGVRQLRDEARGVPKSRPRRSGPSQHRVRPGPLRSWRVTAVEQARSSSSPPVAVDRVGAASEAHDDHAAPLSPQPGGSTIGDDRRPALRIVFAESC
jgi:hypothetical protein